MKSSRKVIKFKKSLAEILQYVDKKCDAGNYVDALSALYFYSSKKNIGYEVWAHIADIYTEMGLYEMAIHCWLKYITFCDNEESFADAYNGLGANYYFLGDKDRAGYYFDKQITCVGAENCVYNDVLDEYVNDSSQHGVTDEFKSLFHIAYSSDGKEELQTSLNKAIACNENGDFDNAVIYATKAVNSKKLKNKALYQRAYALFSTGKIDESSQDIDIVIDGEGVDYKACVLAAYIYQDSGSDVKYNEMLDKLSDIFPEKDEERARQIAFLYNAGRNESAELLLKRCLNESPYSGDLLYLKGVFAYNNGDFSAAGNAFSDGYYYTLSPVLNYYRDLVQFVIDGVEPAKKLEIGFEIPDEEINRRTEYFINIFQNKEKLPTSRIKEVTDKFDWALNSGNESLQVAVGLTCCRIEIYRKYLVSKLIDNNLSDNIKRKYITMLCESMFYGSVGVTYSGYFRMVFFEFPLFEETGYNLWLHAYSLAFGITSMMTEDPERKLFQSACDIQKRLIKLKRIDKVTDMTALSCAMFLKSKLIVKSLEKSDMVYALFSTKKESVEVILNLLK